ncbi:hypothetical protein PKHYL_24230 [Psychrobacter sp. KH172YL61]|nr:hypothetical protein PKHYL_24230 [Psychrobacter sp. KH172YL61]
MTTTDENNQAPQDNKLPVKNVATNDVSASSEELIGWINSRRSMGNLDTPAPTRDQIESAIGCAATAPDHKKLRPWRFIVTQGEARHELGNALVAAAKEKSAQRWRRAV